MRHKSSPLELEPRTYCGETQELELRTYCGETQELEPRTYCGETQELIQKHYTIFKLQLSILLFNFLVGSFLFVNS